MDAKARPNARVVWLLIVLHLALTIPLAYVLNIWADEASTLHTTQNGLIFAIQHAATNERQAPLYFWLMSIWRELNGSVFFARLFSVICSVVAIKLFSGLASKIFNTRAALLATAFVGLHPFLIWASLEIRVYSLVILLSVVLIRTFLDGFDDTGDEAAAGSLRSSRIAFFAVAVISLYTNYYLGFVLVGLFAALIVRRRWRLALDYTAMMAAVGLLFVPVLLFLRYQLNANTDVFQEERSLYEGLRSIWHHVLTFSLPAEIFPDQDTSIAAILRLNIVRVGVVLLAVAGIARRNDLTHRTVIFGAVTAVAGCLFLAAYFILGPVFIAVRHASVFFVPLVLFLASYLDDIFFRTDAVPGKLARLVLPVAGILVLLSFSYSVVTLYPDMAKRGDWIRVAEFIRQNESPNQPIMVFTTFDALALPYYYRGVNQILPDERFFDFEYETEPGTENSLKRQTEFMISEIPPDTSEIWLAVNEKCLTTRACVPLENFLQANYTVIQEREFYKEKVRLLRKKLQ